MEEKNFSIGGFFSAAWEKIVNSLLATFIIYSIAVFIAMILTTIIFLIFEHYILHIPVHTTQASLATSSSSSSGSMVISSVIYFVILLFILSFFKVGFIRVLLDIAKEKAIYWKKIFSKDNFSYLLSFVWANFLRFLFILTLPILIGIILSVLHLNTTLAFILQLLFVLPATIYLSLRLQFINLALVDKKLPGWQAIKESWRLTKGKTMKVLGFDLLAALIIILLYITIIGIFFAFFLYPFIFQANTYLYEALKETSDNAEVSGGEPKEEPAVLAEQAEN